MKRIVIPKDSILCDACNKTIAEQDFLATCEAEWYQSWLYCTECAQKYYKTPYASPDYIRHIEKGADLSKTDLALPIILEFPE